MPILTADDLDLIVVATVTPDMLTPSCGCVLQMKLGATHAVAFDINGAWHRSSFMLYLLLKNL